MLAGNTLYLAGRLGLDPATNEPPADAAEEVRLILDGMKSVLNEAGLTMNDLVSVQVYCADVSLLETFNGVYRSYFSREFPARAFIGSGPLLFGARFEVQGVAVRRTPKGSLWRSPSLSALLWHSPAVSSRSKEAASKVPKLSR